MFPSTIFKDYYYPRRMLLNYSPLMHPQAPPPDYQSYAATSKNGTGFDNIDVVMIFSILLCLLVFTIFINCMIRCLLKCLIWFNARQVANNNNNNILLVHNINNNKVVVNTGVHKRALKTFHVVKYSKEVKLQGLSGECVICLSEFKEGKKVRILPKCNHGFHVKCIDKWLESHTSCPTCRQSLVDTCQMIIGCDYHDHQPTSSSSREMIGISIESLEREDFVRD